MFAVCMSGVLPAAQCWLRPVYAADPPVDAGLLEFLGSVDSEDADWNQYRADSAGATNPSNARPVRAQSQPDARAASDPPGNPSTAGGSGNSSTRPDNPGNAVAAKPADGAGLGSAGQRSSGPAKHPAVADDDAATSGGTGHTRTSSPPAAADEPLPNSGGQVPPPGVNHS
jgi:hypothetical protein